MLKFAIYISNHGYGHATRMAALAEEFIKFGIYVYIRSARPDFIFNDLNPHFYTKDDIICDVGVKHGKNLIPDVEKTRSALLELMSRRLEIVDKEVEFLRKEKIDLIIADIPWLVVEAGTFADVPVFAISNFDWLFIYERLFAGDTRIKPLLNTIFGLYQRVDQSFRLPFSSTKSMGAFRNVEKVGLLAARKEKYLDLRQEYGIDPQTPVMICTFGGEGEMEIDIKKICSAFPGYVFSKQDIPDVSNHFRISDNSDYISLIHTSDILLTKPGYSSFAEASQFGKHLIYLPRENYPEEEILIQGIKRYPQQTKLDSLILSKQEWKSLFGKILSNVTIKKVIPNCNTKIASLIIQRFIELKYSRSRLLSVFDVGSNNLNYALCETGNPIPLHTTQIYTGIGRNYQTSPDGRISIPSENIVNFKRILSRFLAYDKFIDSTKQVIATGIHRQAVNAGTFSRWFRERWNIPYKLLSEKDERELAFLAAKTLIPTGYSALIVDVGGFTTELISINVTQERKEFTLPLGLLVMQKMGNSGTDLTKLTQSYLDQLAEIHPDVIICIGLSATLLATELNKKIAFTPDNFNGLKISRQNLIELSKQFNIIGAETPQEKEAQVQSNDILRLSTNFFSLLLDRFYRSEFIVSYYGISTAFNLWRKPKKH